MSFWSVTLQRTETSKPMLCHPTKFNSFSTFFYTTHHNCLAFGVNNDGCTELEPLLDAGTKK
eukprot:scaffold156105_cov73-Cyclotella_meneghiniana.AAC.4